MTTFASFFSRSSGLLLPVALGFATLSSGCVDLLGNPAFMAAHGSGAVCDLPGDTWILFPDRCPPPTRGGLRIAQPPAGVAELDLMSENLVDDHLDFGPVDLGGSDFEPVTLVNRGVFDGSGELFVEGDVAFTLRVEEEVFTLPFVVAAGESVVFDLVFDPEEEGEFEAILGVMQEDAEMLTVELRGSAETAPPG